MNPDRTGRAPNKALQLRRVWCILAAGLGGRALVVSVGQLSARSARQHR